MTSPASAARPEVDVIQLDVPADPAYVAVVRTAAAGLAARADLTLDRIEDLRIAVDEACALLLSCPQTPVAAGVVPEISCVFTLENHALTVEVTGPDVRLPDPSAFAWAVLEALVDTVHCGTDPASDGTPFTWLRLSVRGGTSTWT